MGEVPVMEEERTRREARVLRYKEKRQTRLFSKKIRYQVRKLNADKRPRLKVFVLSLSISLYRVWILNLELKDAIFLDAGPIREESFLTRV